MLSCVEINNNDSFQITIIWLHGLGADGNDFVPIANQLQLNLKTRFLLPHAPVRNISINNNMPMRAWYDIANLDIASDIDRKGIEQSCEDVYNFLQKEQKLNPNTHFYLAGFSQGGVIALQTFLTHDIKVAGIIALSSYLPTQSPKIKTNPHTPLFLAHGKYDPLVPYQSGRKTYTFLQKHNYNAKWFSYPIAHEVSAEEIHDLEKWLNSTFDTLKNPKT